MAELNPPWALQNLVTHTAAVNREHLLLQAGGAEGVLASSGLGTLAVTQRGAGANMSVDVAAGVCAVMGDENNVQGLYGCVNDATKNVTIAAADPTNPRRDLIVARVQDAFYSGGTNAWSLAVIQGTPAASPSDPAMVNNAVCLARVTVPAAASSIVNANITDLRAYAPLGIIPVNSARQPGVLYGPLSQEPSFKTLPVAGMPIFEQDTFSLKQYTTGTTGFVPPWNMPWGQVARSSTTSASSAGVGPFDTNLSVTFTAVANRLYRYEVLIHVASTVATDGIRLSLTDGSNVAKGSPVGVDNYIILANSAQFSRPQFFESPAAGSITRKIRVVRIGGSGNAQSFADVNRTAFLNVYDDGPSANPA